MRESFAIADELLAALEAIHAAGVIHKDLKPENVLMAEAMTPKVADFGVSREGDDMMTMTAVGTPLFSSPEIMAHEPYDGAADVRSDERR